MQIPPFKVWHRSSTTSSVCERFGVGVIRMGPEVMSRSCADVMITLLRNAIVRNDRDANTEYMF